MFKRSNPKIDRLKEVGLFEELGEEDPRATSEHAEFATFEPGATLVEEGRPE